MNSFARRRLALGAKLKAQGIEMALFEDTEGRRDTSIRYFSGHPGDALLFIAADGRSVLVPWDINMATQMAQIEQTVAYTDFKRNQFIAVAGIIDKLAIPKGSKIGLPSATPYPLYVKYVEACEDHDFVCEEESACELALGMRAVKDEEELSLYKAASAITDKVMDLIEAGLKNGALKTESDVALFIERSLREHGCEGTGFDTISAGPSRSFGIHAFPGYTGAAFGTEGMSILDFGLKYKGYTTDVTMTFVRGKPDRKRAEMIALVQRAYDEAVAMCAPGVKTRDVALRVDAIFAEKGYVMPHGLGHGVGLEAHEMPHVRSREDNAWVLEPGHIITIEPGLYDLATGGVRLENDILITKTGYEVLTHSRIVMLP